MRAKWRELAPYERALVLAVYAIGFAPFLLLREVRTTVVGSAVVYLALLPVVLAVLLAWYRELKVHRAIQLVSLTRAIGNGQLVLHYQPQIALRPPAFASVEALVRRQHPKHGLQPPAAFLPAVTDSWLAKHLDLAVLELALEQFAAWQRRGDPIAVAVNFSPRSLLDATLAGDVEQALRRHGVPADALEVEVTELALEGGAGIHDALRRMRALGVRIALDDFGIGHSSLARLVELPVDRLKIDRVFVSGMATDRRSAAVVRATIDVAHELHLTTVAEGVEDAATLEQLAELGCDYAQGYFLSRPLPADEIPPYRESLAAYHAAR